MGVTLTMQPTCVIHPPTLAFGIYRGVQTDATATIQMGCTNTTPYSISLNAGTTSGATVTSRKMTGSTGGVLAYALFRDSAYLNNWGNTIGTDTASGTGNGTSAYYTIYGRTAAGQYVSPGSYTDTITATVTY